jgi:hypothetical protein
MDGWMVGWKVHHQIKITTNITVIMNPTAQLLSLDKCSLNSESQALTKFIGTIKFVSIFCKLQYHFT